MLLLRQLLLLGSKILVATAEKECALGWGGPNCDKRLCGRGDDPVSAGQSARAIVLKLTDDQGSLHFMDDSAVLLASANAAQCSHSLSRHKAFSKVNCEKNADGAYEVGLVFDKYAQHSGNPSLSEFRCENCEIEDLVTENVREHLTCSGRGSCHGGQCNCDDGFYGELCDKNEDSRILHQFESKSPYFSGTVVEASAAAGTVFTASFAGSKVLRIAEVVEVSGELKSTTMTSNTGRFSTLVSTDLTSKNVNTNSLVVAGSLELPNIDLDDEGNARFVGSIDTKTLKTKSTDTDILRASTITAAHVDASGNMSTSYFTAEAGRLGSFVVDSEGASLTGRLLLESGGIRAGGLEIFAGGLDLHGGLRFHGEGAVSMNELTVKRLKVLDELLVDAKTTKSSPADDQDCSTPALKVVHSLRELKKGDHVAVLLSENTPKLAVREAGQWLLQKDDRTQPPPTAKTDSSLAASVESPLRKGKGGTGLLYVDEDGTQKTSSELNYRDRTLRTPRLIASKLGATLDADGHTMKNARIEAASLVETSVLYAERFVVPPYKKVKSTRLAAFDPNGELVPSYETSPLKADVDGHFSGTFDSLAGDRLKVNKFSMPEQTDCLAAFGSDTLQCGAQFANGTASFEHIRASSAELRNATLEDGKGHFAYLVADDLFATNLLSNSLVKAGELGRLEPTPIFVDDRDVSIESDLRVSGNVLVSGSVVGSGPFVDSSDKRLKTDIEDLDLDLQDFLDIRSVRYKEISTGRDHLGFIAQEIQELFPEVVQEDNEMLGVAYGRLTPILVKALQVALRKIDRLEQQILLQDGK